MGAPTESFRCRLSTAIGVAIHSNAEQLASALNNLSPAPGQSDVVDNHLLRIQELLGSADGALLEQCQRASLEALRAFYQEFTMRITQAFFEAGGQGPVIADWGRAAKTTLFMRPELLRLPLLSSTLGAAPPT
jgi:hypothetical protein